MNILKAFYSGKHFLLPITLMISVMSFGQSYIHVEDFTTNLSGECLKTSFSIDLQVNDRTIGAYAAYQGVGRFDGHIANIPYTSGPITVKLTYRMGQDVYTTQVTNSLNATFTCSLGCAGIAFKVKLNPLKPSKPDNLENNKKHCFDQKITLNLNDIEDQYTYFLNYGLLENGSIQSLGQLNIGRSTTVVFDPNDYLTDKIVKAATLTFSVSAMDAKSFISPPSDPVLYDLLPVPPTMDIEVLESSCAGSETGRIRVKNITSVVPGHEYGVRVGYDNSKCSLDSIDGGFTVGVGNTSPCGWTDTPEWFAGTSFDLTKGVAAGNLRVYLTYEDGSIRNCFTNGVNVKTIFVPSLPVLSVSNSQNDVSCAGETNGQVQVNVLSGGGNYNFALSPPISPAGVLPTGVIYRGLPAGDYTVTTNDKCGIQPSNFTINTPTRVTITNKDHITNNTTDPTCIANPNGSIPVLEIGKEAYQTVTYRVNGVDYDHQSWRAGLPAGIHTIDILDADRPGCDGDQVSVTLNAPVPLQIGSVESTHLKCFDKPEGLLEVGPGTGGSGSHQYNLYHLPDNTPQANAGNLFSKLNTGDYRLTLRNVGDWCADSVYQAITIHTPPQLIAALTATDVVCHKEGNGTITPQITGGTGTLVPEWQQQTNNMWLPKTLLLDKLTPGDYRVVIKDANNCLATSNQVSIKEPLPLTGTALMTDIRCFGEKGYIKVSASGGNNDYIFRYNAGSGYTNFPADSLLGAGTYAVKVTDRKGCETLIKSDMKITAPEAPLAFTYTTSNYNGFHISCFGNDNGHIDIQASGGNSAGYSGYTYKLNNLMQVDQPLFAQLTANDYTITVSDGRGCQQIKTLQMTQPASGLSFATPVIKDVSCYDHTDGSIQLKPSGGTAPFTYRINENDFVSPDLFDGLGVGTYDFSVRDINGCQWKAPYTLKNTIPKMEITATIKDVNCYGGNDGQITTSLSGGRLPVTYQWKETQRTEKDAAGLVAGQYTLLVTDDAGCLMENSFEVNHPQAALSLAATTKPLCANIAHGFIRPQAAFGTPPYRYAIDSDQHFVFQDEFPAAPGTHRVYALDANNCKDETSVEVVVRNEMPLVNFMAASLRYTMDTLVLKEVNLPMPDSIHWSFPEGVATVDNNMFEPVITTPHPGQYTVQMIGWFSGCDYSLDKVLQFSEPGPDAIVKSSNLKGIKDIQLSPNPNDGAFKVKIELHVKQAVSIKIVGINSTSYHHQKYGAAILLEAPINLSAAPSGVYILTVIAENDVKSVRFIIQR